MLDDTPLPRRQAYNVLRVCPQHALYVCSPIADATVKEDCVMKTMWQSHGKMITCIVFLLVSFLYHPSTTSAQSSAETSMCVMEKVPLNPKTNKPYTPDELKQEPFVASISKTQIKQCLQAREPIWYHHILFEDYRDAWQELAKETGKYDIPLMIEGGVLHANTQGGGIGLWEFRDPTITATSQLTEHERRTLGISANNISIILIRSPIIWGGVLIQSAVINQESTLTIFSNEVIFSSSRFSNKADFSGTRLGRLN
jgi:hypothetical protein